MFENNLDSSHSFGIVERGLVFEAGFKQKNEIQRVKVTTDFSNFLV